MKFKWLYFLKVITFNSRCISNIKKVYLQINVGFFRLYRNLQDLRKKDFNHFYRAQNSNIATQFSFCYCFVDKFRLGSFPAEKNFGKVEEWKFTVKFLVHQVCTFLLIWDTANISRNSVKQLSWFTTTYFNYLIMLSSLKGQRTFVCKNRICHWQGHVASGFRIVS